MKKWIVRIVVVLIVVALVGGVVYSMRPKPVLVEVAEVATGTMRVSVTAEGRTRVKDRYVVTSTVHGNLARVELKVGDRVTEEVVLARIEPTAPPLLDARQRDELVARERGAAAGERQASAAVARADKNARHANRELARLQQLFRDGLLSEAELESAQLTADTVSKDLDSARFGARVAKYDHEAAKAATVRAGGKAAESGAENQLEIRTPIAGTVLHILHQSEGVVEPGEPLVELADPTALEIVADVLTAEAVEVTVGDPVEITQWGGEQPLKGRVVLIEPAAFTKVSALGVEEQRVNVVIGLEDPPEVWARLGDGFRVEAEITLWQQDDVVELPLSALFRDGTQWAVFVVADGKAHTRAITIGRRNDFAVQVESGVEPGEQVIVHPGDALVDGSLVETR